LALVGDAAHASLDRTAERFDLLEETVRVVVTMFAGDPAIRSTGMSLR
jgi:hypothetical protein